MTDERRALPSVHALLASDALRPLVERTPRGLMTEAVRTAVAAARQDPERAPGDDAGWAHRITREVERRERRSLARVLNATGVVLHTNLGRAPLAQVAVDAVCRVATGYSNLEYDLDRGERGSRYSHCVTLLRELTGAEDALVVNNGAAALLLALSTLADGREAVISRGELLEIGGSFRIPDIMAKSGAQLVEVGTTNRTHLDDYRRVLTRATGALVKVHRSNFTVSGFVAEVGVRALGALGVEHGVAVVYDLGSGLLMSLEAIGLRGEPIAADAVRDGATVVTMSGDKLLGGPQAGIAVGRAATIAGMRGNPLTRAMRVDKLTLAALEATLAVYRAPERALREIPTLALLAAPVEALRARATRLCDHFGAARISATVVDSSGSVGGGAFPAVELPSVAVALEGDAASLQVRLRRGMPPVIGRIVGGQILLDLRAIPSRDDGLLAAAVVEALA
jgi:L-seryl-tRNA(Ser) seleniumtransferase